MLGLLELTRTEGKLHWLHFDPQCASAKSPNDQCELYLLGEVFNEDLRGGKPETALLNAYLREDVALFPRLNGQFALILVDQRIPRLTLVSDRTASTALFYCQRAQQFAFSSTLRGLIELIGGACKISLEGLASFLACGCFCDGKTLVEGVEVLKPGQALVIEEGHIRLHHYWSYTFASERDPRAESELSADLLTLLQQAVARRTHDDDRFGILLSGGYDSRAILGCAHQVYPARSLQTITWGESESSPHGDVQIARAVSESIHARHSFFRLASEALPHHFRSYVRLSEGRTDAVGNYPEALAIFN